jgi:hypothetical protein
VAETQPQKRGADFNCMTRSFLSAAILTLCIALPVWSQSGRKNEPGKGGVKPSSPGPIAEPGRPRNTSSTSGSSSTSNDEVDDNDVVRITSNLVPIPVSVVDPGGNAIVNLKLEDFELRVDGTSARSATDAIRNERAAGDALRQQRQSRRGTRV